MERRLKERVIGASVLVMLAVIFIPMVLDDSEHVETKITGSNIPQRPETEFTSRIVPLPGGDFGRPAAATAPAGAPASAGATPVAAQEPVPQATPEGGADVPGKTPPATAAGPERVGLTAWVVQLGSFSSEANASGLDQRLRTAGYTSFVETLKQGSEASYRVRVGPELLRSEAQALRDRIKAELGLDGIVVSYP